MQLNNTLDTRFLRETPWFSEIEPAVLSDLLAKSTRRSLGAGETLFREGHAFHGVVYILQSGEMEVRRAHGATETPMAGYLLGLSSYLADTPYPATALARTDVELFVITGEALWALERQHPALFDALNRLIARRLRERSATHAPIAGVLMQPVMAVMGTPLVTCSADITLHEAYRLLRARKLGSLAVLEEERLLGLLTYPTLAARLMDPEVEPDAETVRNATRNARTIGTTTPLWRADELMDQDGVNHLVVIENEGPVGMLSRTDVVRALVSRLGNLRAKIAATRSLKKLSRIFRQMGDVAAEALESNRRARAAVRLVSEGHLAIQRRCLELTIEQMQKEGWGPAPIPFAFIVMGSGGRKEMMLDPDQDNGIILSHVDGERSKSVTAWFEHFCRRANQDLDQVGYPLCPGDIMARTPLYHKTLSSWQEQVSKLVRSPNVKAARFSNIVFDFRTLYGDENLTLALHRHVHEEIAAYPRLLQYMVQDDAEGRPPLNLFNQLITQGEGKVDVKRNGLRIIADAARILALRAGISNCNTNDRLDALARLGVLSADFTATVAAAYDELLEITLAHQIKQYRAGEQPDKLVIPDSLPSTDRETLRVAMRAVKRFQDKLHDEVGTVALPF
jgi:CBS domain-containing protein